MRKLLYILSLGLLFTACNDGDIIEAELDFDDDLEYCDIFTETHFLYNVKDEEPYESLVLIFPSSTTNDAIFNPEISGEEVNLTVNGSTIRFNYRTYSGDPTNGFICEEFPDNSIQITNDYEAASGATVNFISNFTDDDEDGIPSEIEDADEDGDGDYLTNPTDRDGDGIPDYIDTDDDNDNVLTINEGHNYTEDDGFANALDTDGDGVLNYLDVDDDGDGVITRYEDEDGNKNPGNDFANNATIARYLDVDAVDTFVFDEYRTTTYTRTVDIVITILNVNIDILSDDQIDFGTYTTTITLPEDTE